MAGMQQTIVAPPAGDFRLTRQWNHGLCGCFDNMGICIIAFCFPCVTFGQAAEGLGKSCCVYGCLYMCQPLGWCLEANQRRELRKIRGIPGNCMTDLCLTLLCPFCTLIQELQEVEEIKVEERMHAGGTQVVVVNNTAAAPAAPVQAVYHQPTPQMQAQNYEPPAYSADDVNVQMKRE